MCESFTPCNFIRGLLHLLCPYIRIWERESNCNNGKTSLNIAAIACFELLYSSYNWERGAIAVPQPAPLPSNQLRVLVPYSSVRVSYAFRLWDSLSKKLQCDHIWKPCSGIVSSIICMLKYRSNNCFNQMKVNIICVKSVIQTCIAWTIR